MRLLALGRMFKHAFAGSRGLHRQGSVIKRASRRASIGVSRLAHPSYEGGGLLGRHELAKLAELVQVAEHLNAD
jgi:hypothetical protein